MILSLIKNDCFFTIPLISSSNLVFSLRIRSSGTLFLVLWWIGTNVSEAPPASLFRIGELCSFERLINSITDTVIK
jgi:hypothetical protein